jgi:hypothetical protein
MCRVPPEPGIASTAFANQVRNGLPDLSDDSLHLGKVVVVFPDVHVHGLDSPRVEGQNFVNHVCATLKRVGKVLSR